MGRSGLKQVINDVNYVLRKTPKSKPIIAHIDKLRQYFGEVPALWEAAMAKEELSSQERKGLNQ